MNKFKFSVATFVLIIFCGTSVADSLELADGTIMEGDFVGSSNGIIMFDVAGSIEAYPKDQVVGIYLSDGVETAEEIATSPQRSGTTVPAGTRLVIRMVDSVDSKKHGAGHKFRGQLEGALVVDGVTVAPRGTFLYGTVVASEQARRAVGSSEMTMVFTDIMINEQLYPISTEALGAQTENEAKKTAGRTARAAAIGGLIDGSSGAKTGAKVGLGASIVTGGASVNVPAGTLLETTTRAPIDIE